MCDTDSRPAATRETNRTPGTNRNITLATRKVRLSHEVKAWTCFQTFLYILLFRLEKKKAMAL